MGRYSHTLRVKILKSVFLTVVIPAFFLMVSFYIAWNAYVRVRIVRDVERSTQTISERIASDLAAFDLLMERLRADRRVIAAFSGGRGSPDFSGAMRDIYTMMKDRRVKAVLGGIRSDGRRLFSTMGPPADDEDIGQDWGLYGLMRGNPGSVVGYQRTMRYGKIIQTDYSLGTVVIGAEGRIVGYLTADLSFRNSQDLPSERADGVTGRFILTNEFDRIVTAYDGSSIGPFDRFSIAGEDGETDIGGSRFAFARREVGRHGLFVYGLTSIEFIKSSFRFGLYTIGVILTLFSGVFALVLARSVKRMTRPMYDILGTMGKVSQGDFSARLDVISGDEFEEIAVRLNALIVEMESTVQRLMERIELAKTAEMKQLEAQFDPHFLYNTIDTAKWMMKMGETEKASLVLTNMAKVLRYSVHGRRSESTVALREDIVAIKTYLEIHKLSLGDKLEIVYDIDDAILSCRVPKLLVQPIVENALVHGIGATGGGRLGISIRGSGGDVVIKITDSGEGFAVDPARLALSAQAEGDSESGMGMGLVFRRARLHYGDRFSFDVKSEKGSGSVVTLTIPMEAEGSPCTE
jgi:two-component system sensor histidine kinase YesM